MIIESAHVSGPWSASLGADPNGFVKTQHEIKVNHEFAIFSEVYPSASRFGALIAMEPSELDDVSVRDMLAKKMNSPYRSRQSVAASRPLSAAGGAVDQYAHRHDRAGPDHPQRNLPQHADYPAARLHATQ
ncbi:MAG: hypothetical protein AAF982_07775 [Pseudomonadota bacterium]